MKAWARRVLLLACAFAVGYTFFGTPAPEPPSGGPANAPPPGPGGWPTPIPPQPLPPPPPPQQAPLPQQQQQQQPQQPAAAALPPPPPPPPAPPLQSPPAPAAAAQQPAPGKAFSAATAVAKERRSGVQSAAAEIDMWSVAPTLSMENRYNPPRQSRGVGSWTQGWDITADNAAFEQGEKLEIYVVPHSHNDPGWKETFEEWYHQKTGKVLDTMVRVLQQDKRWRFQWSEVSFIQLWWKDQNPATREAFKNLVVSGQLELTGGGLVMNDEALTTLFAIIENVNEGRRWIEENIGVTVDTSWQNDPFGLSATMSYLYGRMDYLGMWIQRVHYRVKAYLAHERSFEFWWRQHGDPSGGTDIYTHMNPFYAYDVPHTCGPEPGVCCQFDFPRMSSSHPYKGCPWGVNPQPITPSNVGERASKLLEQYRKKASLYRTRHLLAPIGNDFEFMRAEYADNQFNNYQAIFDHMNSNPRMNVHARFATLHEYFRDVKEWVTKHPAEPKATAVPVLKGSFFTYADKEDEYWSGYYTSRPFVKRLGRELESMLHAAEMLHEYRVTQDKGADTGEDSLQHARLALSIFQHHDAITGTAKEGVVNDYARKLDAGFAAALNVFSDDVSAVVSNGQLKLSALSERHGPKDLATPALLPLATQKSITLVHYNPTSRKRAALVRVRVDTPSVCVREGDKLRNVQLNPVIEAGAGKLSIGSAFEVVDPREIPAFGLITTVLVSDDQCAPKRADVWDSGGGAMNGFSAGSLQPDASGAISVSSAALTATFSRDGMLASLRNLGDHGEVMQTQEKLIEYAGQGSHSGAYLFRPQGQGSTHKASPQCIVVRGEHGTDVYTKISDAATRVAHLSDHDGVGGAQLKMDYLVDLGTGKWMDKDLLVRFESDVASSGDLFTDLNGFQMDKHTRPAAGGPKCTYFDKPGQDCHPIQSHFFPMVTSAFVQGPSGAGGSQRLTLHSMAPCAVASLRDGWLEAGLDRRLSRDDEKGLMEGVKDNVLTRVSFALTAEHSAAPVPAAATPHPTLLSRRVSENNNRPVIGMFGSGGSAAQGVTATWQGATAADWPCDVSLESFRPGKLAAAGARSSQTWLYRSSFAAGFAPPPACAPSVAGASGQFDAVQLEAAQMFSACATASVTPVTLGGGKNEAQASNAQSVQLDRAPEVAAFELSCTLNG